MPNQNPSQNQGEFSSSEILPFNDRGDAGFTGEELEEKQHFTGPSDFYGNLAEDMDEGKLSSIAGTLLEGIEQDKESRSDWETSNNLVLKYTGFKVEEFRDVPFLRACSAFDSTLATALIRFYTTARAELYPSMGPVDCKILGIANDAKEDQAERMKQFFNYFLMDMDQDYYSDSERFLIYVGFFGCAFKKVYQDPISNYPCSRFVKPQDLIINNHTVSVLSSDRITQVMYLSKKEILARQESGIFKDVKLPDINDDDEGKLSPTKQTIQKMDGIDNSASENKSLFKFYEVYVDLDLNDKSKDESLKPYIVTICATSKKILSIVRNWKEGDKKYTRKIHFVHAYYLPGFGIYGLGLAHMIGSNAITLSNIQRQLIDAGTLKNFPGGLRQKGLRFENNNLAVGPSEFLEIDTGGGPISESVMLMPYAEPSAVLLELRKELIAQVESLVSTAESSISETNSNTPVGTTLALLEVSSRFQSSIMRSLHVCLGREFKLLFNLFKEYMGDEPYPFTVQGKEVVILKQDFNDNLSVLPVSNPELMTKTQRIMHQEAILKLVESNPDIHDVKYAFRMMYKAIGVEDIDKLLKPDEQPPKPYDPVTENMLVLMGKGIEVDIHQDHDSHLVVHKQSIQEQSANPNVNPATIAALTMHCQKHEAMKFVLQIQQHMQQPLNITPEQALETFEIQNAIAHKDAEETKQKQEAAAKAAAEAQAKVIDPNQVMLAQIEQEREASHLRNQEAHMKIELEAEKAKLHKQETDLKVESDSHKAQLRFESEKAKLEGQVEMSDDKNRVDIQIEKMKHHPENIP